MALITSAASGNFNAGATWTGGVVPVAGDEARASTGHTITINVNTTCDEVSNDGTGIFTLNDGITLTANVTNKTTTSNRNCVQFTAASPAAATIIGTITGGNGASGVVAVVNTSSGTLNITGNCRAQTQTGSFGVNNASTGTVAITGNCSGNIGGSGGGSSAHGANNASTGTLTVTGNCTGSAGGSSGFGVNNASSGTVIITGNCVGNVNAVGANNTSGGTMTITGNCTGAANQGANNASSGTMTITGNCTGGAAAGASGASNSASGTMIVNGSIYATETSPGVSGGNRAQVTRLTGPFYTTDTFGVNPIGCLAWRWDTALSNTTFIEVPSSVVVNGVFVRRNLVTPDNATNFPSASNVRSGTTYGISRALTGTCAVPPAASVATGVPVDNTTGTAALTPADFWNALTSGMTTSGSIGVRLKNASTLDSTGQQLADALSP